jgi:hypothetical protein
VALEITASAITGGIAGFLFLLAFDPFGQTNLDVLCVLGGMAAGIGINRLLRG